MEKMLGNLSGLSWKNFWVTVTEDQIIQFGLLRIARQHCLTFGGSSQFTFTFQYHHFHVLAALSYKAIGLVSTSDQSMMDYGALFITGCHSI
jgi:hypothetical protein